MLMYRQSYIENRMGCGEKAYDSDRFCGIEANKVNVNDLKPESFPESFL
jgi:hypothetical protein